MVPSHDQAHSTRGSQLPMQGSVSCLFCTCRGFVEVSYHAPDDEKFEDTIDISDSTNVMHTIALSALRVVRFHRKCETRRYAVLGTKSDCIWCFEDPGSKTRFSMHRNEWNGLFLKISVCEGRARNEIDGRILHLPNFIPGCIDVMSSLLGDMLCTRTHAHNSYDAISLLVIRPCHRQPRSKRWWTWSDQRLDDENMLILQDKTPTLMVSDQSWRRYHVRTYSEKQHPHRV